MIKRFYDDKIENLIAPNKVLVVFGPRRVGKTTLLKSFINRTKLKFRYDNGGNLDIQDVLSSRRLSLITEYVGDNELLIIDEAQKIPYIGEALKLIVDSFDNIRVVVTGSSSFDLLGQVGEPLVGRKNVITLYPIAAKELLELYGSNKFDFNQHLEDLLVFGSYPEVIISRYSSEKIEILKDLVNSYLLKDILSLDNIKDSRFIRDLLMLLAYQIGNEVSFSELAGELSVNIKTIQRYLDLLEKTFVIYHLSGYSKNLRTAITSKNKYYFFDNGVRNAIIDQFNNVKLRDNKDVGRLWENYLMMERMKNRSYSKEFYGASYFLRTYNQEEIDLIEDKDGILHGFEFKWSEKKRQRAPYIWKSTYANSTYKVINRKNYLSFIT